MKNRRFIKLLYFDGFAVSGEIIKRHDDPGVGIYNFDIIIGAARLIIETDEARSFDEYYFVEMKIKISGISGEKKKGDASAHLSAAKLKSRQTI